MLVFALRVCWEGKETKERLEQACGQGGCDANSNCPAGPKTSCFAAVDPKPVRHEV